ncbi:hypothetical protein L915_10165 [Phytophthora nicotianae]|nr:hypothetical protein L915_10165 [Phytophthora nicotianae]
MELVPASCRTSYDGQVVPVVLLDHAILCLVLRHVLVRGYHHGFGYVIVHDDKAKHSNE